MVNIEDSGWRYMKSAAYFALVPLWAAVVIYVGGAGWYKADLEHVLATEIELAETGSGAATVGSGGGFVYDGIPFRSPKEARKYIKQERVTKSFPWIVELPWWSGLMLLGMGASILGSLVGVLGRKVTRKLAIADVDMFWEPLVAGLMGGVVAILLAAVPAVISGSDVPPRPLVLAAVAIAGGYDIRRLRRWLGGVTKKLMPEITSPDHEKDEGEDG